MQKIKKTTIVDIARACGVSVTTVSRILNERPDVSPETRQRVLEYMKEEGFAPQNAWQQLRSGKSRTIALHFPQDFNPPSHEIITNASMGCREEGYSLNILATPLSDNDLLSIFRSGQADGMILMETLTHDRRVDLLRQNSFPFILIGRCADNLGLSFVDTDIEKGIADAIQHLVTLGHHNIGFVTMSPTLENREYGFVTWALQGYEAACKKHQLPILSRSGGIKTGENESLVIDLLDKHPEITAILTPQQNGVNGILKAIQFKGLQIPDDISIIGLMDNSISELITPPLTSIGFPSHDMGYEAAKILISQLEKDDYSPRQMLLRPELIVRGSSGPVRTKELKTN
ncbi:MAG TPA: LacI family DNA-binding transcriptional regulator [Leptolinea sp.]